jgi:glutathione peroxidase
LLGGVVRVTIVSLLLLGSALSHARDCPEALDHKTRVLAGSEEVHLCERYHGKVVLIVNTASKCVYTPQYDGLEDLYGKYRDRGFVVLGFPSNDFGAQEPGTEAQVQNFCRLTYNVEFPMFEKTHTREGMAGPLYQTLARLSGDYPRWNFHKYLIGPDGSLAGSFPSRVRPNDPTLVGAIEKLLPTPP